MKGLFFALVLLTVLAVPRPGPAADPCLDCHAQKTPGLVAYWRASAHAVRKVGCIDCHGSDREANHAGRVTVDATVCGGCHKAALTTHRASKHGAGLKAGMGCTRNKAKSDERDKSCSLCHKTGSAQPIVQVACAMFLAQSPAMQRQGCLACHQVEVRCDSCHTRHGTDLSIARSPGVCGVCHMGPDHPQAEMWETSMHGVLYSQGRGTGAPACATCHMHGGSHDVSRGISPDGPPDAARISKERTFMLSICAECHTPGMAARSLADGDTIREQSGKIVAEARAVVEDLQREGLLSPAPSDRPPHPLAGNKFVIGPHMLYEDLSSVESLFFKLKQFYAPTTYKGAFHQNPDYAHWYGNAPMKLTLSEIKSEASLLRQVQALKKRVDNLAAVPGTGGAEVEDMKRRLREIEELRLKGEISAQEYEKMKKQLLDETGL
jgi:hypothetical protein